MKKHSNKLILLGLLLGFVLSISQAHAFDRWHIIYTSCANCDTEGSQYNRTDDGKANKRYFVSNPVYGSKRACLEGAFYDVTGLNGTSIAYKSETKAISGLQKKKGEYKRKDFIVHDISLQKYCD